MAKTQNVRLIAAATAFLALSLPQSSSAQFFPPLFPSPPIGTWTGYESYDILVSSDFPGGGSLSKVYSGSGTATLYIGLDYMYIFGPGNVAAGPGVVGSQGAFVPPDPFGPTSASGSLFFDSGPAGSATGNFFLTYESILPNGQIDVGNGSAVADLTTIGYGLGPPDFAVITSFATFTTVPEPPSSVLAGLAILVIAAVAWVRRFRRRAQARLS